MVDFSHILIRDASYWGVFITLLLIVFFISLTAKTDKGLVYCGHNSLYVSFVVFATVLFITFCTGADKPVYEEKFRLAVSAGFVETQYWGWSWLTYIISLFTNSSTFYFFIIATLYIFGNLKFCKYNVDNYFPLFLAVLTFMGFYSYGVNTIKSGLGLSLAMLSLCYFHRSKYLAGVLVLLAISIHSTTIIPIIAYILANYLKKTPLCIFFWLLCVGLSFALGPYFRIYFSGFLGVDDRFSSYLLSQGNVVYNTSFRFDFLIYSAIPILLSIIIKKWNYHNEYWDRLFRTYLISNSFWVLLITIPYTDRVAYLSWFLIPYILLIPILDYSLIISNRKFYLLFIFILFSGFNIYQLLFS